jgi:hypothetical protein
VELKRLGLLPGAPGRPPDPPWRWLTPRGWTVLAAAVGTLLVSLIVYLHAPNHHGDIDLYRRYAEAFWSAGGLQRPLPTEYPPLALVPFTLTLIPPLPDAVSVFGLWMLLLFAAGVVLLGRLESPRVAEVAAVYLALGAYATAVGRYDLVPLALTLAAYWAARRRRFPLAYALLALGALIKLYPAALLPVVALEQYRSLGRDPLRSRPPEGVVRGVALFLGLVCGGFALARLLDPDHWLGAFTYGMWRPLQVESVGASLLWLTSLAGFWISPDRSFHSYNLVGSLDGAVGLLCDLGLLAGLAWVLWRQATGRIDLARALAGVVLVLVITDRVFSPQYLIWVLPLVAVVERDCRWSWLLVCALTTLIFPIAYGGLRPLGLGPPVTFPLWFLGPIALRNAVLVAATVRLIRGQPSPQPLAQPRGWERSPAA